MGFELVENVLDMLSNLHDISNGHILNKFTWNQLVDEISQVLLDSWDEVFDSLTKSRIQDVIDQVIEDAVSTNQLVLKLVDLSNDLLKELLKDWLDLINTGLNLVNHVLDGSLHLGQNFSHHGLGLLDLGLDHILDMLQKVLNFTFDDARFNLVLDLVENVLDVVGSFNDIADADVFGGLGLGCRSGGSQRGQSHEAEETKNSH